jgi:hypothetical protein
MYYCRVVYVGVGKKKLFKSNFKKLQKKESGSANIKNKVQQHSQIEKSVPGSESAEQRVADLNKNTDTVPGKIISAFIS